jgi:hypothetical protein
VRLATESRGAGLGLPPDEHSVPDVVHTTSASRSVARSRSLACTSRRSDGAGFEPQANRGVNKIAMAGSCGSVFFWWACRAATVRMFCRRV